MTDDRMLAAVIDGPPGIDVRERPVPRPGREEVRIAVERVGICGSDVPMWSGVREVPEPHVPGHEFAGRVVETGEGVDGVAEGDRVTSRIHSGCDACDYCRRGLVRLCDDIRETGINRPGAFAEYVVVDAETVHRLPEGMSFATGASADPVASAYRGVRQLDIDAGDSLVVVGPGPIGLYGLQLGIAEGADRVVMLGTRESRNEVARRLGADATVDVREEDVDARLRDLLGDGADAVLEATGNPDAVPTSIRAARKGGRISLVGLPHDPVDGIDANTIVRAEKHVSGAFLYTYDEFRDALALLDAGRVTTDGVLTHTVPLDRAEEAFRLVDDREAIKVQLDVS